MSKLTGRHMVHGGHTHFAVKTRTDFAREVHTKKPRSAKIPPNEATLLYGCEAKESDEVSAGRVGVYTTASSCDAGCASAVIETMYGIELPPATMYAEAFKWVLEEFSEDRPYVGCEFRTLSLSLYSCRRILVASL